MTSRIRPGSANTRGAEPTKARLGCRPAVPARVLTSAPMGAPVLKVAVVGCGKIADGHVEEIQKMPERARVVAVCDREILLAEQIAVRYGIAGRYDRFEELLDREK